MAGVIDRYDSWGAAYTACHTTVAPSIEACKTCLLRNFAIKILSTPDDTEDV